MPSENSEAYFGKMIGANSVSCAERYDCLHSESFVRKRRYRRLSYTPPRVSCFEFFVVERLASMYLTALSLSDTSNRLPTEIKRRSAKEKHRKHRANTPKLHSRDALCRAEKPRSSHERICFFAFSSAAMTLSHQSSNSGSLFWNSGCARIF